MKKVFIVISVVCLIPFYAMASDDTDKLYSEYYADGKWMSYDKYVTYLSGKINTFCASSNSSEKCQGYCRKYRVYAEEQHELCGSKKASASVNVNASNVAISKESKSLVSVDEKKKQEEDEKIKQDELQKKEDQVKQKFENMKVEKDNDVANQNSIVGAIEKKSSFVRFLVGPGYKNIVQLKNEIGQNSEHIKTMQGLLGEAETDENKRLIQEDLQKLQSQQEKLIAFAAIKEKSFSLFGWVANFFE
ncbi:MAG: hypothetical protein WC727_10615 [Ignavibacteriaceae bacterium]|jgi:hypothetical protein